MHIHAPDLRGAAASRPPRRRARAEHRLPREALAEAAHDLRVEVADRVVHVDQDCDTLGQDALDVGMVGAAAAEADAHASDADMPLHTLRVDIDLLRVAKFRSHSLGARDV